MHPGKGPLNSMSKGIVQPAQWSAFRGHIASNLNTRGHQVRLAMLMGPLAASALKAAILASSAA